MTHAQAEYTMPDHIRARNAEILREVKSMEVDQMGVQLYISKKTEATRAEVKNYIKNNYERFLIESKEIDGSEFIYSVEDNVYSSNDIIFSEVLNFCLHKNIAIKW